MKNKVILITLFISVFAYAETKDWVVKIENRVITAKEFQSLYSNQLEIMEILSNYQMDSSKLRSNKQFQMQFLESYVTNSLLGKKLKEENKTKKFIDEAWARNLSQKLAEYVNEQLYTKYYIEKVLLPTVGDVSDKEVEEVYNKHKNEFKEVTATQAAEYIKKRIKMQKAMLKMQKYGDKVKGESRIFRNDEYFEK